MTDQSQTRWARGPVGRVAIRHRYLPDAEITNTFLSEGLAATGLRVLMPPSCGHTGLGGGQERWGSGRLARERRASCPRHPPTQRLPQG